MKLAVIGAAGKTGRAFVNAALDAGHEVRAGMLRTSAIFEKSDHLSVIRCDATEPRDVDALVQGCDAVISLIGHGKNSPDFLQTIAISNALDAMKRHHIARIISLTGTGVRQKGDVVPMIDAVLNTAVRLIDPVRIRDGIAHAQVLEQSKTDWSVVRVLKLTDGPENRYTLTLHGPARPIVSRTTVAYAILGILSDSTYYRTMPVVSSRS